MVEISNLELYEKLHNTQNATRLKPETDVEIAAIDRENSNVTLEDPNDNDHDNGNDNDIILF